MLKVVTGLRGSGVMVFRQDADRAKAGDGWIDTGLVFTTRHGTPIEPRNFNRSFDRCIIAARVPRITVHGARKTCASLLAALDVRLMAVAAVCCCQDTKRPVSMFGTGLSAVWT